MTPEPRLDNASLKSARLQPDGLKKGRSRATSPSVRSDGGRSTTVATPKIDPRPPGNGVVLDSTINGTRPGHGVGSSVGRDADVEETSEDAPHHASKSKDILPAKDLEVDRIRREVESRPGSPGIDPRRAIPMTAEDVASLPGPLLAGFNDEHHKAATVHLPSKEDQERRLREIQAHHADNRAGRLSINLPDGHRPSEVMSSPGSTAALSATTPALHDTSTDTSPDEGYRYEQDKPEHRHGASSPHNVPPSTDEAASGREQERLLQAQIDVSRADIFRNSPAIAEAAAPSTSGKPEMVDSTMEDAIGDVEDQPHGRLTTEASEIAQDIIGDQREMAAEASRTEDHPMPDAEPSVALKTREVPDSEGESQTPAEATTVKDSFESRTPQPSDAALSPVAHRPTEAQPKASIDSQKSSSVSSPRRQPSINAATPPVERMTTRVSSGAMRHKSVSEILGEIPRPNTSVSERNGKGASDSESVPDSSTSQPLADGVPTLSLSDKLKEKERSKLSTVVFARQFKQNDDGKALVPSSLQLSKQTTEDYFMPLFLASASNDKARGQQPLEVLLSTAHKTISTANAYVPILEAQTVKVLKRIYTLQNTGKWSLRQPKRAEEPTRPTCHWDQLVQEVKWMRTDFREERKWKMTVARNMAYACAEWFAASPENRKLLQVKVTTPPVTSTVEVDSAETSDVPQSTPDLIAHGEEDSPMDDFEDEPRLVDSVAPTAIFALGEDDVVFGLRRSPTSEKLLNELPMYGQPLFVANSELSTSDVDPDRSWKRRALPLSKFIEGCIELKEVKPPRKRSRYDYEEDDDEDELGEPGAKRPCLEAEQTNVALFNPEYKHVRDRIHSAHHFRPPSEFPMPMQSFFECRMASQWTWAEDDELRNLVREYTYNWSLIASILSTTSMYSSGAERRTPWECFERWIHLEGLPADMQKTHYFRAYNNRLEAANRTVMIANAQVPQVPNANGQVQPRRRQTTSVRVERRRNQKHLTIVDAMRKLAKKRETTVQKQAHAAQLAALRKNSEVPTPKNAVHTPQDFSKLKHEREEQTRERIASMQLRAQEVARRVGNIAIRDAITNTSQNSMQQRNAQQPGLPNGTQNRNPSNAMLPNGQPMNGQNLAVPGQRPRTSMSMTPNPLANNMQIPMMNGIPQAPMMNRMAGQIPMPNPGDLLNQAQRVSAQQRQQIMQQQQGQLTPNSQMHGSPPRNGISQGNYLPNGMMQPPPMFNPNGPPNTNGGVSTPPPSFAHPIQNSHSPIQGHQGSPPRMMSQGSPVMPAAIEAQIRTRNPSLTDNEVLQVYQNALKGSKHLAQQAMTAAAGGGTPRLAPNMLQNGMGGNAMNGMVGANGEMSPQMYAQMMAARAQAARDGVSSGSGNSNGSGGGGNANQGNQGGSHAHSRSGSQGSSGGGQN